MPGYQWAKVYMAAWPSLRVAAMRLLSLSCSASACEHSWSIEGWIHSKKRNRMGQATVEHLVRCHTNILLESNLEDESNKVPALPWEEEMEVHEPEEETSEPETSRSRHLAFDELNGGDNESEGESQ